jgi:hypothetical protein
MLTMFNTCCLVSKRVSFKSRFHKIPALEKENGALHMYLRKIMIKRVRGYIGVGSYRFSDVDDGDIPKALNR